MKLKGKLKEGFFEWLMKNEEPIWQLDGEDSEGMYIYLYPSLVFYDLPQSAQFGLLQEYADTLGYKISIYWREIDDDWFGYIGIESISESFFNSRPEAQLAAIEKLNEIVNN